MESKISRLQMRLVAMGMDEDDRSKSKNVPATSYSSHGSAPMHAKPDAFYTQLHSQIHARNRVANNALPFAQELMHPRGRKAIAATMLTKYSHKRSQHEVRTKTTWGGEKDHQNIQKFNFEQTRPPKVDRPPSPWQTRHMNGSNSTGPVFD
jgi:hypothetical protein